MSATEAPAVGVVIPTRDRPALLRRTLAAVRAQTYRGTIRSVVVYDRAEPDTSLADNDPSRPIEVVANERVPGLAGARNTGMLRLHTEFIAFCDDDDEWLPGKIEAQVDLMTQNRSVQFCGTGMQTVHDGALETRTPGSAWVTYQQLLRARVSTLHPSSFLIRREALDEIGLVAEDLPGSYAEDWDLLLRAAQRHPIGIVDEPLVRVLRGRHSYFTEHWQTMVDGLEWLVDHHDDLRANARGMALVEGKMSFALAALGRVREARQHARAALRRYPVEPRAYLALAVSSGLVSTDNVLRLLDARRRSI